MTHKRLFPIVIVALALTLAACGGGDNNGEHNADAPSVTADMPADVASTTDNGPYTLSGTVIDIDGNGIPGIQIMVAPSAISTTTDDDGRWSIDDITNARMVIPHHVDYDFEPEHHDVGRTNPDVHFVGLPLGCIPTTPCKITDVDDLQNIKNDLAGYYILTNDIDASVTQTWNNGQGFEPLGSNPAFTGRLDGNGFEIKGLYINRPDAKDVALFARLGRDGVIENIGLVDGSITGTANAASLVATNEGTIRHAYNRNNVTNTDEYGVTGGLVSRHRTPSALITDSYNAGTITSAGATAGGVVGDNYEGTIRRVRNEGAVTASGDHAGGVIADNTFGVIEHAYNTAPVTGDNTVGGIAASNSTDSRISYSYNTGPVKAAGYNVGGAAGTNAGVVEYTFNQGNVTARGDNVGGLIGNNRSDGFIGNSYSSGNVTGTTAVGGLVGKHDAGATINHTYSVSTVHIVAGHWADPEVGGLVGTLDAAVGSENLESIKASFFKSNYYADGPANTVFTGTGTAKAEAQLKDEATYADSGWDFDAVWTMDNGQDFPDLAKNPRP